MQYYKTMIVVRLGRREITRYIHIPDFLTELFRNASADKVLELHRSLHLGVSVAEYNHEVFPLYSQRDGLWSLNEREKNA